MLVSEPLLDDIKIIKVKCTETMHFRIKVKTGVHLYIRCVHLPTQANVKHVCTDRFNLLQEDICDRLCINRPFTTKHQNPLFSTILLPNFC